MTVDGTVTDVQYLGADCRIRADIPEIGRLAANVPSDGLVGVTVGQPVRLAWSRYAAYTINESVTNRGGNP